MRSRRIRYHRKGVCLLLALALMIGVLTGCAPRAENSPAPMELPAEPETNLSPCLIVVDDDPDTVDFQCTSLYYTVAQNVFNRLVEMENDADGNVQILPSLAKSWDISDDRRVYTFHLRENVRFSDGSALTASDVGYTLSRLLTHPESCNGDIAAAILGAKRMANGETDTLEGFEILGDLDFRITLEQPFEAFLACLSMPGASILDEESTKAAGDRFGKDAAHTVGTGSFILTGWEQGKGMLFTANPHCWEGPPRCAAVDLRFLTESETIRRLFENGTLDILDLDDLGSSAEYFIHGDIYQQRLHQVQQIGTTYVALNSSMKPLDDVRVRRALQLALNRSVLLDAVYSGRGSVENGIFPHGLYGYNPELPEIPYAPDEAKSLLAEAGYPDGFALTFSVRSSATQSVMTLAKLVASMWEKIGVRVSIDVLDESEFMRLRKSGALPCYAATWIADFNDPDNFIYTFFGSRENSIFRSLCYARDEIISRVQKARMIADAEERVEEYRELERIIVQEDAAWIPLFSRLRFYVTSERTDGFRASWNGSVKNNYRHMSVDAQPESSALPNG